MPVTFDNSVVGGTNGATLSVPFTVGANATLLVFVASENTVSNSISAITIGTTALTQKGRITSNSCPLEVWVLTAAPAGVSTLSIGFVAGGNDWALAAVTYKNVKDTGSFGTVISKSATATASCSLVISSTTVDIVVAAFGFTTWNQAPVLNSGTTRATGSMSGVIHLVVGDMAGALAVTISATAVSSNWMMLGIPVIFSVSTATTPRFRSLLGVGY